MVSVIQNQKVERRKDPMAIKNASGHEGTNSANATARPSVSSYRSSADAELRRYSRNLDDYARTLDAIAHEAGKANRPSETLYTKSRNQDARTVNALLKEWEDDSINKASGAKPVRTRKPLHAAIAGSVIDVHRGNRKSSGLSARFALDAIRGFVSQVQQIPVILAALFAIATMASTWFVPATIITGLMAVNTIALPVSNDSDAVLADFTRPMSEDNVSVDLSNIDTKKFDMLSLRDYVVQPGDSIGKVANHFNLHVDTIISFNSIANPRWIAPGTKYQIPNRDGLLYKVKGNDNLAEIAKRFGVTVTSLLDGNNLSDEALQVNAKLFIPEARMNPTDLKMLLGELFIWPVNGGLSDGYGYRQDPFTGVRMFHNGIDLAGPIGTPVRAALEGRVVAVESQVGNYGKMIIIQHPRGIKTLYGHLSAFKVEVGQYVSQGQIIGRRGNTGRSTGPHTHFSVIVNGSFVNPMRYLR